MPHVVTLMFSDWWCMKEGDYLVGSGDVFKGHLPHAVSLMFSDWWYEGG